MTNFYRAARADYVKTSTQKYSMNMTNEEPEIPDPTEGLRHLTPMSPALYREYIRDTVIFPTIKRWGFEERFQQELSLIASQQKVYEKLKKRLKNNGAILALVGPRGLGKTSLAAQVAQDEAWKIHENSIRAPEAPPRPIKYVIYKKAAALIARYKPLYADFGSLDTERLLESLDYFCREQEIVVIDELHDCEDQKMKTRVLTDLIDRRYAALRDTILISNQTPEDFSATIGDSILSRLSEHGAILECRWASFRL